MPVARDRYRPWGATAQFMSEDKFELNFLSPDQFELKSMEGAMVAVTARLTACESLSQPLLQGTIELLVLKRLSWGPPRHLSRTQAVPFPIRI